MFRETGEMERRQEKRIVWVMVWGKLYAKVTLEAIL
jgi:hypothetical protein